MGIVLYAGSVKRVSLVFCHSKDDVEATVWATFYEVYLPLRLIAVRESFSEGKGYFATGKVLALPIFTQQL